MALFQAINHSQQRVPIQSDNQLAKSLSRLSHGVHAGSTVVLLSDFHGFNEAARKSLGAVLNSLDIVAVHITDPLDHRLPPPGKYPISSSVQNDKSRWLLNIGSNAERKRYAQHFSEQQQDLKSLFAHNRHCYIGVSTDAPLLDSAASVLARQPLPQTANHSAQPSLGIET